MMFFRTLFTMVALSLLGSCGAYAAPLNIRDFSRDVDPRQVTVKDKIIWYAGESVTYTIRARRGKEPVALPPGTVHVWTVLDADEVAYIVQQGDVLDAAGGVVRFWLPAPLSNLPAGKYESWVHSYESTNRVGVLDHTSVEVRWRPGDDYTPTEPLENVMDEILGWWGEVNGIMAGIFNALDGKITAEIVNRELAVGGVETNLLIASNHFEQAIGERPTHQDMDLAIGAVESNLNTASNALAGAIGDRLTINDFNLTLATLVTTGALEQALAEFEGGSITNIGFGLVGNGRESPLAVDQSIIATKTYAENQAGEVQNALISASNALNLAIGAETTNRTTAFSTLQTRIGTEETNRANAVSGVISALNTASNALRTAINAKPSAADVANAAGVVQTNLIIASNSLRNAISTEATTRSNALLTTQNRIGLEETNRAQAVSSLIGDLGTASNALRSAVNARATPAYVDAATGTVQTNLLAASNHFQNAINNISGAVDFSAVENRIGLEETNRAQAVSALTDNLNTASNSLRSAVNARATPAYVAAAAGVVQTNLLIASNALRVAIGTESTNRAAAVNAVAGNLTTASNHFQAAIGTAASNLTTASNHFGAAIGTAASNLNTASNALALAISDAADEHANFVPACMTWPSLGPDSWLAWDFTETNSLRLGGLTYSAYIKNSIFGHYLFPSNKFVTVTHEPLEYVDYIGDYRFNSAPPMLSSDPVMISLMNPTMKLGQIQWSSNVGGTENDYWIIDNNTHFTITNTGTHIISQVGFRAAPNGDGLINTPIGVYINSDKITSIMPYGDDEHHIYDVGARVHNGEVLEIRVDTSVPAPPTGSVYPKIHATPMGAPGEGLGTGMIAYGLQSVDLYDRVASFHGQLPQVDYPVGPLSPISLQYLQQEMASTIRQHEADVRTRKSPIDMQWHHLGFGERYRTLSYLDNLIWQFGGNTFFEVLGDGAMVIPEIRSITIAAGGSATLTAYIMPANLTAIEAEMSTDLDSWTRVPAEDIVDAHMIADFTASFTITNTTGEVAFYRLVDASGGDGVVTMNAKAPITINGVPVATSNQLAAVAANLQAASNHFAGVTSGLRSDLTIASNSLDEAVGLVQTNLDEAIIMLESQIHGSRSLASLSQRALSNRVTALEIDLEASTNHLHEIIGTLASTSDVANATADLVSQADLSITLADFVETSALDGYVTTGLLSDVAASLQGQIDLFNYAGADFYSTNYFGHLATASRQLLLLDQLAVTNQIILESNATVLAKGDFTVLQDTNTFVISDGSAYLNGRRLAEERAEEWIKYELEECQQVTMPTNIPADVINIIWEDWEDSAPDFILPDDWIPDRPLTIMFHAVYSGVGGDLLFGSTQIGGLGPSAPTDWIEFRWVPQISRWMVRFSSVDSLFAEQNMLQPVEATP